MKTYGIVLSAKSARKHRRAGHAVQRRPYGGWAWVAIDPQSVAMTMLHDESILIHGASGAAVSGKTLRGLLSNDEVRIRIGHVYTARRRNAASKPVIVTGFSRKDGQTIVSWKQGDKTGHESPQAFAQRVHLT